MPPRDPSAAAPIDEELNSLEDAVRRLKVEYDVFFGGGSKKPPVDTEWRVQSLVKKLSDSQRLTATQRFRYNTLTQKYAIFNALWQQKLRVKEEGYRRPQDALLAIQGLRTEQEHEAAAGLHGTSPTVPAEFFCTTVHDAAAEARKVKDLYAAMLRARERTGEGKPSSGLDSFIAFIAHKTKLLREQYASTGVEFRVELDGGKVKLKARAV